MKKKLFIGLSTAVAVASLAVGANATPFTDYLTPNSVIDVSSGTGTGSGNVNTGHSIFKFYGFAGDTIDIDITVTEIFEGLIEYCYGSEPCFFPKDDDSQLFLFNNIGEMIADNDDEDDNTLQSLIDDFVLPTDGYYYAGVTTWDNEPYFSSGIIDGWWDDGMSNFTFDVIISGVSPVPEPATLFLFGTGLTGLVATRLRKRKGK